MPIRLWGIPGHCVTVNGGRDGLARVTLALAMACGTCGWHVERVGAQSPVSSFSQCMAYVDAARDLGAKFDAHRTSGEELLAERAAVAQRLQTSWVTVAQLHQQQMVRVIHAAELELMGAALAIELNGLIASKQGEPQRVLDPRYSPESTMSHFFQQYQRSLQGPDVRDAGDQLAAVHVSLEALAHDMKSFREAERLTIQRYLSQLQELERVVQEMMRWSQRSLELFDAYWELADVAGVRSPLELRMVLRELERASEADAGALFARAITLTRLERSPEALALLEQVSQFPPARLVVQAARAEILIRDGQTREGRSLLGQTLPAGSDDARVRLHRAQAYAAAGDLRSAANEWKAVLQLGGHEIAARRGLALLYASQSNPSPRELETALDQAQLASQLAGDDWSCELALGLAWAAHGDDPQALAAVGRAGKFAAGENQTYCEQVAAQIQAGGSRPVWNFSSLTP